MNAARDGSTEIIQLLIAKKADVNATCCLGNTALILAAYHGRLEAVQLLLAAGSDVNAHNEDKKPRCQKQKEPSFRNMLRNMQR